MTRLGCIWDQLKVEIMNTNQKMIYVVCMEMTDKGTKLSERAYKIEGGN